MLKNMVYSWKCKIDESIMMLGIKVGLINVGVVILSIMYVRGCYSVLVPFCGSMVCRGCGWLGLAIAATLLV
jgi:hypothetical protein